MFNLQILLIFELAIKRDAVRSVAVCEIYRFTYLLCRKTLRIHMRICGVLRICASRVKKGSNNQYCSPVGRLGRDVVGNEGATP